MNATIATNAAPTERPVAPIAGPVSQIEEFAGIINAKLETANSEIVPILAKIETNTAVLRKLIRDSVPGTGSPHREHVDRVATATGVLPARRRVLHEALASAGSMTAMAPAQDRPVTARRVSREEVAAAAEAATPEKQAEAKPVDPKERISRGEGGRFVKSTTATGKIPGNRRPLSEAESPSLATQQMQEEKTQQDEQRGIIGAIAKGFQTTKGKVTEAAKSEAGKAVIGRAVGGPLYEAFQEATEVKNQLAGKMTDEKSSIGKAAKWAMQKAGISSKEPATDAKNADIKDAYRSHYSKAELAAQGDAPSEGSDEIIAAIMKGERSDDERHRELVRAIVATGKPDPRDTDLPGTDFPLPRKTGPGSSQRRGNRSKTTAVPKGGAKMGGSLGKLPGATLPGGGGGGMLGKVGSMAAKVLPLLAAAPLGAITAGIAAVGAVGTAGYSAVTGKDNFISKGAQKLGLVPQLETDANGKIVAGAVATASESGKGGAGTVSTGKNDVGGPSYGKKQLASAGGDKSQVAQFVKQSSHAKEFEGLMPGTPAFDQKWKDVAAKDKNFGTEQDAYVAKAMSAPVIAKAVKGGFNTEDIGIREALISQSVNHGPGGNKKILASAQAELVKKYGTVEAAPVGDQIDALTTSRKTYVNQVAEGKATTAQKLRARGDEKGAVKAEGEARQLQSMAGAGGRYDQENAITKELSATGGVVGPTAIAQTRDTASVPVEIATASPVTDTRTRILSRTRAKTAAMGAGGLEARPLDDATILAGERSIRREPVTSLATGLPSRKVSPPERMTMAMADAEAPAKQARGYSQGGSDMSGVLASLDKLNATMTKMTGKDETMRSGFPQIRTEFDDTMLQLMAYDRV